MEVVDVLLAHVCASHRATNANGHEIAFGALSTSGWFSHAMDAGGGGPRAKPLGPMFRSMPLKSLHSWTPSDAKSVCLSGAVQ